MMLQIGVSVQDFLVRGLMLIMKLLKPGFLMVKLKSSFRKFCDHYHDFDNRKGLFVSQMTTNICLSLSLYALVPKYKKFVINDRYCSVIEQ